MKKLIIICVPVVALCCCSCGNKGGEEPPALPMDTMTIKTVPPPDDPIDTMVEGHYRYETTDKPGTGPDSPERRKDTGAR